MELKNGKDIFEWIRINYSLKARDIVERNMKNISRGDQRISVAMVDGEVGMYP